LEASEAHTLVASDRTSRMGNVRTYG
jgi:hypothetical protein